MATVSETDEGMVLETAKGSRSADIRTDVVVEATSVDEDDGSDLPVDGGSGAANDKVMLRAHPSPARHTLRPNP